MAHPQTDPAPLVDTVAAHASTDVPIAASGQSADEALAALRGHAYDSVALVGVCVDGVLVGVVTLERLLAAAPATPVTELMDPDPPTVRPGTDQEHAAWQAVQHGESALAVVDDAGRFVGLVPHSGCSRCCWPSTTRTWPGSAASSARARPPAPPSPRAWHGGCGTGCRGCSSAWPAPSPRPHPDVLVQAHR